MLRVFFRELHELCAAPKLDGSSEPPSSLLILWSTELAPGWRQM